MVLGHSPARLRQVQLYQCGSTFFNHILVSSLFTESVAIMITTLRSGSPGRSVPKMPSNSTKGILSSSSLSRECGQSRTVALTQILHHALYGQSATSCSGRYCCVGTQGFQIVSLLSCRADQGHSRAPRSPRCAFSRFVHHWLKARSLVVAVHRLHVLFTRALVCLRLQDVGTILLDTS